MCWCLLKDLLLYSYLDVLNKLGLNASKTTKKYKKNKYTIINLSLHNKEKKKLNSKSAVIPKGLF